MGFDDITHPDKLTKLSNRLDELETKILKNNSNQADATQLEYIARFLLQSGYTVEDNDVFATVVAIVKIIQHGE